jgi:pilus assembly protein CpaF
MVTLASASFDHLLPTVQERLLAQNLPWPRGEEGPMFAAFRSRIAALLTDALPRQERERTSLTPIAERFARMLVGVGLLQPLLEDESVEEVIVRPRGHVFVDRGGRVEDLGILAPDEHFYRVAAYVADARAGRALTPQYPVVLVDLAGGERFTAMVPPLSPEGTAINVRRWRVRRYGLDDLAALGTFSPPPDAPLHGSSQALQDVLTALAQANIASVLISGAFSTGKTTLLNALVAHLPTGAQLAVAETFKELDIHHAGTARVVVPPFLRESEDRITLAQAVNSLLTRARPDVIVLGEVTSHDEAREFLRAGNLGVRALATIHGNSAESALVRLADLAVREGVPLRSVREQVADSVDLVVHMQRHGRQRYVAEVAWARGVDADGHFQLDVVYRAGMERERTLRAYLAPLLEGAR